MSASGGSVSIEGARSTSSPRPARAGRGSACGAASAAAREPSSAAGCGPGSSRRRAARGCRCAALRTFAQRPPSAGSAPASRARLREARPPLPTWTPCSARVSPSLRAVGPSRRSVAVERARRVAAHVNAEPAVEQAGDPHASSGTSTSAGATGLAERRPAAVAGAAAEAEGRRRLPDRHDGAPERTVAVGVRLLHARRGSCRPPPGRRSPSGRRVAEDAVAVEIPAEVDRIAGGRPAGRPRAGRGQRHRRWRSLAPPARRRPPPSGSARAPTGSAPARRGACRRRACPSSRTSSSPTR